MAIHFRNPGLLPIEAITTLGVSVKETNSPIGRFGTGLKYTIAGILRMREAISIEVGDRKFQFHGVQKTIRGKVFDIVHMTEYLPGGSEVVTPLGFTTDLGPHWEPWMYIRELWSNMKDEGGTCDYGIGESPGPNETRIICVGSKIEDAFANRREFLLDTNISPDYSNDFGSFYSSPRMSMFYQGIAVHKSTKPLLGTYNFHINLSLTEDRTASESEMRWALGAFYGMCSDEGMLERFLTVKEPFFEHEVSPIVNDSSVIERVLQRLWEDSPMKLSERAKHLAVSRFRPDRTAIRFTPTPVEQAKFDRALAFIQRLGYSQDVKWNFVDPKDSEAFGFVIENDIYICRSAFSSGSQFLAQVMMEEYLHAVNGLQDYSRKMQDHLFAKVISLGEEVNGEPL